MKKLLALTFCFLLCSVSQIFAVTVSDDTVSGVNRYAVYVGCNYGGKSRERLLYAGSDAKSFKVAMAEIGGVTDENSRILIDPTKENIDKALSDISNAITENANNSKRSEFIFYYSGHSDENALLLGDAKYDYSKLKAAISAVPSDIHVVILDSCYSGNFIRTKGGQKRKPFLIDDSSVVTGHAYLSSSSDNESSQESDEIESSYFTNAMITGLRGAADTSGDNKVTLNELYSYAFNDTLSKTESSKAGPQHPNFNITLVGSGDLVLSDLSTAEAMLSLSKDAKGRFIIRDANDKLISEINKVQGQPIFMALPSGQYSALIIDEYSTKQGTFILEKDQVYVLDQNTLSSIKRKSGRLRGDSVEKDKKVTEDDDDEFLSMDDLEETKEAKENKKNIDIPLVDEDSEDEEEEFLEESEDKEDDDVDYSVGSKERFTYEYDNSSVINFMFVPGVYFVDSESDDTIASLGLVGSYAHNIGAIQYSNVFNIATGNIYGGQIAGVFNITKEQVNGIQSAGVFNISNDNRGAQLSGVFNLSQYVNGAQISGFMNIAKEVNGLQVSGFMNLAKEIRGAQISGFMNIAHTVNGLQLGVINYAEESNGITLGLLNYVENGLHDSCMSIDTNDCIDVYYQGGSKHLFTTYGLIRNRQNFFEAEGFGALYAGLGTEITFPKTSLDFEFLGKFVYDYDMSYKDYFSDMDMSNPDSIAKFINSCIVPSLRISWNLFESAFVRIFVGTSFDLYIPGINDYAATVYKRTWTIQDEDCDISPTFNFGIKFKL